MHSSGDLELLSNEARRHLGGDTNGMIDDVLKNYGDHDVLRQIDRVTTLRLNLHQYHHDKNNIGKLKDVLFLDLGLEGYLRGLTEKIMAYDLGFENYIREAGQLLNNLHLSFQWNEIAMCKEDWENIVKPLSKDMNEDNARKVRSVVDRVKQGLGEVNDRYMQMM
jgi:hypothetical protein